LITSYNTLGREAVVFKTWEPPGGVRKYDDVKLWEIVKASCSAPTFFPAHVLKTGKLEIPLIDGGVVANNPTACAIAEGVRYNDRNDGNHPDPCEIQEFHVVSLGTGQLTRPIEIEDAREWGAIEWAVPVIDVLFDGAADAADYIATHIIPRDKYARFQAPLHEAYDDMDDASATNLNALLNVAQSFLDSTKGGEALNTAVKLLK
jgi:patatin-like phospholipase/acyl hydrolase